VCSGEGWNGRTFFIARLGHVVGSQRYDLSSRDLMPDSIEPLRAKCAASDDAATAAVTQDPRAEAELVRTRQIFQQTLDAMSLELLQLKCELQARDRAALPRPTENRLEAEIPFDEIDALLAATPLEK
jgi:hypothetical protein